MQKRLSHIAILTIFAGVASTSPSYAKPARSCETVSGTYAIYANHDLLHVDHSRHFVEIGSDVLDQELEKRGWQDTEAKGHFTLCGPQGRRAIKWTIRDQVDLVAVKDVHFVPRP